MTNFPFVGYKVTSLPASPSANALYYVLNGSVVSEYVTDEAGVARQVKDAASMPGQTLRGNADVSDAAPADLTLAQVRSMLAIIPQAPDLATLAAMDGSVTPVVLLNTTDGRRGVFVWTSGNLSSFVTTDTRQAVYVAPSAAPTGASGAWVRHRDHAVLHSRWFGTVADSTGVGLGTDNAAALQALFNAGLAWGENIHIDKGKYRSTAKLTFDKSAVSGDNGFVPSIFGHGPGDTRLYFDTGVATGIDVIGSTSGGIFGSFFVIADLYLKSSGKTGNGLKIDKVAFCDVRRVRSTGWANGIRLSDVISSKLERPYCDSNVVGIRGLKGTDGVPINAVHIVSPWCGSNDRAGIEINDAATVNIRGGSVEGNGSDTVTYSASLRGGIRLLEQGGGGHASAIIEGVYFENNAGTADLFVFASTAVSSYGKSVAIHGNSFTRLSATTFTTNNVLIQNSTTIKTCVSLKGNGFGNLGSAYTEDVTRKYVAVTDTNNMVSLIDDGSNMYEASVATPAIGLRHQSGLVQTTPFGMGYAAGSGGTVTQATSRTTGVTLNKPTGAITLVSAAGSATYQTFTVTNSLVAADDVVRVCQKSGTDKYEIHVTKVQAGSFDVTFRTTGGTTTEQPVFSFTMHKGATA